MTDREWQEEQELAKELRVPVAQVIGRGTGPRAIHVAAVDPYLERNNPALHVAVEFAKSWVVDHHQEPGRVHLFVVAVVEAKR